jgi:hypothetical protein
MSNPWPHDTTEKLCEAGYSFQEVGKCLAPSCKTMIHWFITPKGKWMPFEMVEQGRYQPHFATCPESRKFSRKGKDQIEERKRP